MTDQSGSSDAGFKSSHPLVQSRVVAFEVLNPPVELRVGDANHRPGLDELRLYLLLESVQALVRLGEALGELAHVIPHGLVKDPHVPARLGKLGLQLILGRHLVEVTVNLVKLLPDELNQGREALLVHGILPPAVSTDFRLKIADLRFAIGE